MEFEFELRYEISVDEDLSNLVDRWHRPAAMTLLSGSAGPAGSHCSSLANACRTKRPSSARSVTSERRFQALN